MKKVEETENILTFTAEASETLVNSLRRYMNQIQVLAINEKSTGKLKLAVEGEKIVHSGDMKGDVEVVYKTIPITPLAEGQELEFVATLKAGTGSEHAKFSPGLMFYRNVSEITLDKDLYDEVK